MTEKICLFLRLRLGATPDVMDLMLPLTNLTGFLPDLRSLKITFLYSGLMREDIDHLFSALSLLEDSDLEEGIHFHFVRTPRKL